MILQLNQKTNTRQTWTPGRRSNNTKNPAVSHMKKKVDNKRREIYGMLSTKHQLQEARTNGCWQKMYEPNRQITNLRYQYHVSTNI